jgi:hypothetical protein
MTARSQKAAEAARVELDLNDSEFQRDLFALGKDERNRVIDTLEKVAKLTWEQVYRDPGLKWERVTSVTAKGFEAVYTIRITRSCRATAVRQGAYMRFLTIARDHDAAYGKK